MISLHDALGRLEKNGAISRRAANVLSTTPDRSLPVPHFDGVNGKPQFVCVLIDQSESMTPLRDEVLSTHRQFIERLRSSVQCRKHSLFVGQYLFSDTCVQLNTYQALAFDRADAVLCLSTSNYVPAGRTALYAAVHLALQDAAMIADCCHHNGFTPSFHLALLTQADDTVGCFEPDDIRKCLDDMRDLGNLDSAGVVLLGHGATARQLEMLQLIGLRPIRTPYFEP